MTEERHPIGIVVGTGMQHFLQKYAKGEWVNKEVKVGEMQYLVEVFQGVIHYADISVPVIGVPRYGRDPKKIKRPHEINYGANMLALYQSGVRKVIATSSVSVAYQEYIDKFIIPNDIQDNSRRIYSLPIECGEIHAEMGMPFDREIGCCVKRAAESLDMKDKIITVPSFRKRKVLPMPADEELDSHESLRKAIIYHQTDSVAFWTRAYTAAWKMLGADLFGVTAASEATIANTIGRPVGEGKDRKVVDKMGYAAVCLPTSFCTHMTDKIIQESYIEKAEVMAAGLEELLKLSVLNVYNLDSNEVQDESLLLR